MPARALVPDRALRPRPRRVHELGGGRGGIADVRAGAARGRLPHRAARQGAPLPRRDDEKRRTSTISRRGSCSSGSPRCTRPATSSPAPGRTATPTTSALAGFSMRTGNTSRTAAITATTRADVTPTKRVPMWDATPMPVPLDDYIDTWHGRRGGPLDRAVRPGRPVLPVRRLPRSARPVGRAASCGRPVRATIDAVDAGLDAPAARSKARAATGECSRAFLDLSDTDDDDRRRDPRDATRVRRRRDRDRRRRRPHRRRARGATGSLDNTWLIYTSDHGEMGGNHGLMSKCVLYEPTVRVPLIVQPTARLRTRVVDALVEHIDVPATVREIAGAPELPDERRAVAARACRAATTRPSPS